MSAPQVHAEQVTHSMGKNAQWKKIFTKNGITLYSAERKGASLPLLKGQAILEHNLYDIMAVVEDAKRHPQWVYRMRESKIFRRPDPFHLSAYVQFDFPWPASDRDSVLKVDVKRVWTPHHEVLISFKRIKDRGYPPRKGIVRIVESRGYTRLRWISPQRTDVIYVIDSDPGGNLPKWLVRWLAKNLPYKVITALRRRVSSTRGQYQAFKDRWDPRRSPQEDAPSQFVLPGVQR